MLDAWVSVRAAPRKGQLALVLSFTSARRWAYAEPVLWSDTGIVEIHAQCLLGFVHARFQVAWPDEKRTMMDADYGSVGAVDQVAAAMKAAGMGQGVVDWRSLAALDQFHVGGIEATGQLAKRLNPPRGSRILDVGSGLGGPARFLAASYTCEVIGVDLSAPFVEVANYLTERTDLLERVTTTRGDALDLPFKTGSFDFAWTQHVAMNIKDRDGLYREILRVLRPGGRLAIYDPVAGEGGDPVYPVPWARTAAHSFLRTPGSMRTSLETAGFEVLSWSDVTEDAVGWRRSLASVAAEKSRELRALALPLVMGPDFVERGENFELNLRERRVRLVQVIAERPMLA